MLFSTKPHVTFYKTICCFLVMKHFQPHPLWHLWQQKNKTPSTGARIHARENLRPIHPPSSNQTNQSTSPPFRFPPHKNIHLRRNINQHRNKHRAINEIINDEKFYHEVKHQEQIKVQYQSQHLIASLIHLFRKAKMTKRSIDKEKTAQICRFFTLWGISTHILIGGKQYLC